MSRTNGRHFGSRFLGAVAVIASALTITMIVGPAGHLGSAGAASGTSIEVCNAGHVSGSFPFTVDSGPSFSIQVGHCVIKAVSAGENLVKELVDSTGTGLQSISVAPGSASLAHQVQNSTSQAGYAKVNIESGARVTVTFTNASSYGQLKVCKVAPAGSGLVGTAFNFTERTANELVGPFAVDAATKPDTSCSGLTRYRVGTKVNVSEAPTTGTEVTGIDVTGGTLASANYAAGAATAIVGPSTVTTVVNYTNGIGFIGSGEIEVCVVRGDSNVQGSFNFDLSSGEWSASVSVTTSQCTEIEVPLGQITVTEEVKPPYDVSSVTAIPQGDLVSENLAKQTGTFSTSFDAATTAVFTDSTAIAQLAPFSGSVLPGESFADQLQTNGVSPVTFSVTSPSPAFTVSSSGAVSAPDTLAINTYVVSGTDSDSVGNRGTWSYTLTVGGPGPVQTAPTGGTVVAGNPFTSQLHTTGVSPVTFTVTSSQPAFTVSSSGAVSAPDALTQGTYTVSGTDSDARGNIGTWSFTLTVTVA